MYSRRAVLRSGGVGLAAVLAGCSGSPAEETSTDAATATQTRTPSEVRVDMTDDLKFDPQTVTIAVGDTVVWETTGAVAHSATAYEADLPDGATYFASGEFESEAAARSSYPDGSVGTGETYSHTFETAGEFPYFCVPHESGMKGTVVVE
jgi:plastocyanin